MGHKLIDQYIRDEYRTSVKAVLDAALQGQATDNFTFPLFNKQGERVEVCRHAPPFAARRRPPARRRAQPPA